MNILEEAMEAGNNMDEELLITSSLLSDADIPPASAGFSRRCLAAVGSSAYVERAVLWRTRSISIAASVAAVAAFAAVATYMRTAETGGGASTEAVVEDVAVVGVTASSPAVSGVMATSNECVVNANPRATALWRTLNAGQAQMAWEWPDRAKSARLTITGAGVTAARVYGKGDAFPVWKPPVPEDFNEDDVFTAKLTFYNGERGGGEEVACLVAEGIGFVRGVSGEGERLALYGSTMFQIVKK